VVSGCKITVEWNFSTRVTADTEILLGRFQTFTDHEGP